MTGGGEEERSKGEDDEERRMRVEEEGRRREILGDAGSRNPSRIFIKVSENRFLSNISKTKPFRVSSAS